MGETLKRLRRKTAASPRGLASADNSITAPMSYDPSEAFNQLPLGLDESQLGADGNVAILQPYLTTDNQYLDTSQDALTRRLAAAIFEYLTRGECVPPNIFGPTTNGVPRRFTVLDFDDVRISGILQLGRPLARIGLATSIVDKLAKEGDIDALMELAHSRRCCIALRNAFALQRWRERRSGVQAT